VTPPRNGGRLDHGDAPSTRLADGRRLWRARRDAGDARGTHNEIHTRAGLEAYDPALAALAAEVFGQRAWRYGCP
jgi:hypothetical protein